MATLIADRFLSSRGRSATGRTKIVHAVDVATGRRVRLHLREAGTREEQQSWMEESSLAYARGTLIDFGLVGSGARFEARACDAAPPEPPRVSTVETDLLAWLHSSRPSAARVLQLAGLPDARALRVAGFLVCDRAMVEDGGRWRDLQPVLEGRSAVLLDAHGDPSRAALALLRVHAAGTRDVALIQARTTPPRGRRAASARCPVPAAAERRPVYGVRPNPPDPRVMRMMAEADRQMMRGRHAAAERTLREAAAAWVRRGDAARAGAAGLLLGKLLLVRGRAGAAGAAFEEAHQQLQVAGAAADAVAATVFLGLAQTDEAQLQKGEQTLRAAHTAAAALAHSEAALFAGLSLARAVVWQGRATDAGSILESLTAEGSAALVARYWCLLARVWLAQSAVVAAWSAVEHVRAPAAALSPDIEALVRTSEASVQAHLGDVEALQHHVAQGLSASRAARLPLQGVRLRVTLAEGLLRAGDPAGARAAARHLTLGDGVGLPALLRERIEKIRDSLARGNGGRHPRRPPEVHETAARFHAASVAASVDDFEVLRDLVAAAHRADDEADAGRYAAAAVRRHVHASGVGIFVARPGSVQPLATCGGSSEVMARRSVDIAQPAGPEPCKGAIDAAVPIQYLGRTIGALTLRWPVAGPDNVERVMAFCAAAATVCAPLVYVHGERQTAPPCGEGATDLVGVSPAVEELRRLVARAAHAPFTVLIEGESGSGKELVARAIHRTGARRERQFCAFNCAAMPEDLVDAELFGYAKGAFTGAAVERVGLFESADGGTVFLDEIGELSPRAQAKVLRVLQEGEVRRIGEHFTRPFDTRLVAATNRSLRAEVEAGRFRQDLLYRLDVIRIAVPPLRDRPDDIPILAARFWQQSAGRIGSRAVLGQAALAALARYDWPGNVRELQNVLSALAVAVPARGVVSASDLPAAIARAVPRPHGSLEDARLEFERRFVRAALARSAGHRGQAAASLGLSRQGLTKLMQRLHIDV